ncbi:unnamed protein product, partial [Protopolystoma xenopodis]
MTRCINGQTILEENYDPEYNPSLDELHDYASILGIDPNLEADLMHIAREGINTPLPKNWKACQDTSGDIYYFNFANGKSIWDHPCDEYYRERVFAERKRLALLKNSAASVEASDLATNNGKIKSNGSNKPTISPYPLHKHSDNQFGGGVREFVNPTNESENCSALGSADQQNLNSTLISGNPIIQKASSLNKATKQTPEMARPASHDSSPVG